MDMLPIAEKLEAEGLGTQATDLFINFMPMECKQGILLRSPLSGTPVDGELPGHYRTRFSLIVRSHDYLAATEIMENCMVALTVYQENMFPIFVKYMRPASLPVTFPVSDGNYYEIKTEFDIAYNGTAYGY